MAQYTLSSSARVLAEMGTYLLIVVSNCNVGWNWRAGSTLQCILMSSIVAEGRCPAQQDKKDQNLGTTYTNHCDASKCHTFQMTGHFVVYLSCPLFTHDKMTTAHWTSQC